MFDVKVVQFMEASGQDRKYGIGPVGDYGSLGGRVCDWHKKIFNLMSLLEFFTILICFHRFRVSIIYLDSYFYHQNYSYQLILTFKFEILTVYYYFR